MRSPNENLTAGHEPASSDPHSGAALPAKEPKHKRTPGMWLTDGLIYPLVNNVSVFVISMIASYKTSNFAGNGLLKRRGKAVEHFFEDTLKFGEHAPTARVVSLSFADGCLVAPVVALLENKHKPISQWIDHKLHTTPADDSVYGSEPKRGFWKSIVPARAATALIVVPVAIALEKVKFPGSDKSINQKLFYDYGSKLGRAIDQTFPSLKKLLGNPDMEGVGFFAVFEAFYTSVCTAGFWLGTHLNLLKGTPKSDLPAGHSPALDARPLVAGAPPSLSAPAEPAPPVADAPGEKRRPKTRINALTAFQQKYDAGPSLGSMPMPSH